MNNKRKVTHVEHKVFNDEESEILGWIGKGILGIILLPVLILFPLIILIEFLGGKR